MQRDHDPETSDSKSKQQRQSTEHATTNRLPGTTLQHCRAQQQQATPCACDRSALYCVELPWKAPEIRHPSHLFVPGISRLLAAVLLWSAQNNSNSAKSTLQPALLSRPAAAGNVVRVWQVRAVLCRVALSNLRSVTHHILLCWSCIFLQQLHVACMHVAAQPALLRFRQQ